MNSLIGDWIIDPDDKNSLYELGQVWLRFGNEGVLTYTVLGEETDRTIVLVYEVKEDILITCQPSHPRKEETKFSIVKGKLKLEFNATPSWFIRFN